MDDGHWLAALAKQEIELFAAPMAISDPHHKSEARFKRKARGHKNRHP